MPVQLPRKHIPIRAVLISWAEVKRIYDRLAQQVEEQAGRELVQLIKKDEHSQEEFDTLKQDLRSRAFKVTVTINGRDGDALLGDSSSLFESSNIPNVVASVYMTNITAYRGPAALHRSIALN